MSANGGQQEVVGKAAFLAQIAVARAWFTAHREQLKKWLLIIALALFCGGLVLSLRATPDILDRLRVWPLIIIAFLILPAGMALSAIDYQMLARLSGARATFWQAAEITFYSRAVNMLPVPGSIAVRLAALKTQGVAFKRSGALMFLFTAVWGGAGFCFSAAWLVGKAPFVITMGFAAIGVLILGACVIAVLRFRLDPLVSAASGGLRFLMIILEAYVLLMGVRAIGVDAEYQQTAILVAASFLATIVPAGIGVRETIVAGLSPMAGIDPAVGFLAAAAARAASLVLLAVCALAALAMQSFRREVLPISGEGR